MLSNIHQGFCPNSPKSNPRLTEERQTQNFHTRTRLPTTLTRPHPQSIISAKPVSILSSSADKDYRGIKKRAPCKTLFMRGAMHFLMNQVLHSPFSMGTMECYMANNKTQALIKYPIHNSIKRLC